MPKVSRGNPRSRQVISGDGPSLIRAGAASPVVDGKSIWVGRAIGLFSIPNQDDEALYFRVEVGNLTGDEFELSFERGVLNSAERIAYPVNHEPDFSAPPDPNLNLNRYSDAQRQSGAMFTVPPQSRVHVAIRLKADRQDLLEFPVAIYEHAGPDLDSPTINARPVLKTLEWIPAPTADKVETKIFSTPGKFLFWELAPEPDWVRFRRWNVAPRAGRFPWSLGLFHHPECVVRVTNNSTLPVAVSPRLVVLTETAQGGAARPPMEELLDTRSPLAPGEEREWPCPLSLNDRRLAKQEADQMRVTAYAEVLGPSSTPIGKAEAPELVRGEYVAYPSKVIDWVVMAAAVLFFILFLTWVFVGIPWPHSRSAIVQLDFAAMRLKSGDLPQGLDPSSFHVYLTPDVGKKSFLGVRQKDGTYRFDLGDRYIPGWMWPGRWKDDELTLSLTANDPDLYTYAPDPPSQTVSVNEHSTIQWNIKATASGPQAKLHAFNRSVQDASTHINAANKLLNASKSAADELKLAQDSFSDAKAVVGGLAPEDLDAAQQKLRSVDGPLAKLVTKQADFDKANLSAEQLEQKAEAAVKADLDTVNTALDAGKKDLPGSRALARVQLGLATDALTQAGTELQGVKNADVRKTDSDALKTATEALSKFKQAIASSGGGGGGGDLKIHDLEDKMKAGLKSLIAANEYAPNNVEKVGKDAISKSEAYLAVKRNDADGLAIKAVEEVLACDGPSLTQGEIDQMKADITAGQQQSASVNPLAQIAGFRLLAIDGNNKIGVPDAKLAGIAQLNNVIKRLKDLKANNPNLDPVTLGLLNNSMYMADNALGHAYDSSTDKTEYLKNYQAAGITSQIAH